MSKYPPLFTPREDARALVRDVRRLLGLKPSTVIISNTSPLTKENPMTLPPNHRPPGEPPEQHWINAAIEVCPDADGGWKVTEYTGQANTPRILYRSRTKRTAVLVGRGAALTWKCDLRVKDRKGRYTRESTSYAGNGLPR